LAPDVVTQEAEQYEDDLNDPTEGDGSNHIVKELKRFIRVYDFGSTTF
jgi:hypothetical protein